MCAERRDLHVVPVQTRISEVGVALQEGRGPVDSVTQVVVVVTGCSLHEYSSPPVSIKKIPTNVQMNLKNNCKNNYEFMCIKHEAFSILFVHFGHFLLDTDKLTSDMNECL